MINNFYSSISNGNLVDKCSHKQHHVPEQPYLLRNNFLSEFRTALEKAKVRANLGIADSETLFWGNIQGDIAEQADISKYINSLLAFDYSINNNFDAGDNFQNIKNVRDAAITCLDYLSKFKGEGAEIQALDTKIKEILRNLYDVDSLDDVASSQGGVINKLSTDVENLQQSLGNPNSTVEEIETKLDEVEEEVNQVNAILTDINSLLVRYEPTDGTQNALQIIEDSEEEIDGETVVHKGGLYVKDLQPQIDELNAEINGDQGKISLLQKDIQKNTEGVQSNKTAIADIQNTSIPTINTEIQNIKRDYISKESLGSSSPIVTDDKLQQKLNGYVKTNSTASLQGITSQNDSINIDKPFNFTTNDPGDSRRYVAKKEDLLTITNYWPGMEVIVIEDALMYILKKDGDPADPTYDGWKIADSLKIEVLSIEEFEERQKAGDLNPLVYYYIYSDPITFREYPKRADYTSEEDFEYAVELWRKDAYILQNQYMSAAWGQDIDNRIKAKVDKANFDTLNNKIATIETFFNSTEGDTLASLKESIQTIYKPAYIEIDSDGKEVNKPASGILVTLSDQVNDIDGRVETLEDSLKNSNFVTWDELGGEGGDSLVDGQTLFVKTSTYKKDRESDAKEFTTEKLTFPGTTTIHHDAVEEVSHIDETTGEKVVDVEAQEAYDEEVPDPLSVTRNNDRIKVGEEEVAFREDLLKSVEFDSYPIYFEWIQGRGTIDGTPEGQTYDQWIEGKNLEDWYFLIKYDGTVLPPKNEGESQEAYEARLVPFKKGMLVTAYDAENIFATKGQLQATRDDLTSKVNTANLRVTDVKKLVTDNLKEQNDHINQIETNLNQTCATQREEILGTLYTAWGEFYTPESGITDLSTIINTSKEELTTNITEVLKTYTTEEVERVAANKLEESTFKNIWGGYYEEQEGSIQYTPLKTIIDEIVGDGEGDSLSLTSLKAQIDLRETTENHDADIATVRNELTEAIGETRNYANTLAGNAQRASIEACLNSIPITYKELKALRDAGGLITGRHYRIIDYKTTSKESNTKVIWHAFDIIVTAVSNYELSENAFAAASDANRPEVNIPVPVDPDDTTIGIDANSETTGDTEIAYDEDVNAERVIDTYYDKCNLSAWELKYMLDNNTKRYSWADDRYKVIQAFNNYKVDDVILIDTYNELSDTNKANCEQIGKGVIYYMKDEFGNECSYDFKSILFERFLIEVLDAQNKYQNWINGDYYSALSKTLENQLKIVPYTSRNNDGDGTRFYYTFDTGNTEEMYIPESKQIETVPVELTRDNAQKGKNTCRDNHFAYACNLYNIVSDGESIISIDKNKIVLGNNVFIGTEFISNTCSDQGFSYNTILNGAKYNSFGGNFAFNIIGENFINNVFGHDCKLNILAENFQYNTTGNKFQRNCIIQNNRDNLYKESFIRNSLSHSITDNIFGNNINNSKFPDFFKNNELGGDTIELKIDDNAHYMRFCYFNKGIYNMLIQDSDNRSKEDQWYQYIHFNQCNYDASSATLELSSEDFTGVGNTFKIEPGKTHIVEIQNVSDSDLKKYVWCPADIIKFTNTLNDKVVTLESNLSTLTTKVQELTTKIQELTNKVQQLEQS